MKYVVIGQPSGRSMEQILTAYPQHRAFVDELEATGEVLEIGPFTDLGNLGVFATRACAERFATQDPFLLTGMVASYSVHEWNV